MKLSEAMRLGAMLRLQGVGDYFVPGDVVDGVFKLRSCALGAAWEAVASKESDGTDVCGDLAKTWSYLDDPAVGCPRCLTNGVPPTTADHTIGSVIAHLNDCHRWTREQIADWVATVEPSEDEKDDTDGRHEDTGARCHVEVRG